MAMSKRWFVVVIVGLVLVLGGVVGVVIWSKYRNSEPKTNDKVDINEQSNDLGITATEPAWIKKSKAECQALVRENSPKIEYSGSIPRSSIAIRQTILSKSGSKVIRNAYWLSGNPEKDAKSFQGIKAQGCEGVIPVIVIKMRPTEGLTITDHMQIWDFYKPSSPFETWSQYDKKLNSYLKELAPIPAIVLLEPDLLMFAFDSTNQQYRWRNEIYESEFLQRAQKVITKLPKAWVYVDAGNAGYLSANAANMEQMATTLLRLDGLRGFALNTGHFVNKTYNDYIAKRLYCKTGLHYVTDTSRNAGSFSMQAIREIEKCPFDPPNVIQGLSPGWGWGSNRNINRVRRWINQLGQNAQREQPALPYRTNNNNQQNVQNTVNQRPQQPGPNQQIDEQNRNINNNNNNNNNHDNSNNNNQNNPNSQRVISNNQHNGNSNSGGGQTRKQYIIRSATEAAKMLRLLKANSRQCLNSPLSRNMAHDANVWIQTPGESDGRLYAYGTLRPCLMGHTVGCDDDCKLVVQQGTSRSQQCFCDVKRPSSNTNQNNNDDLLSGFPF